MNINKKVQGVVPFALTMGMKMPTDRRGHVRAFVQALRGHDRHDWCVYRGYNKRQTAYSAASYLRSQYKDIDWQAQKYSGIGGGDAYRVLAKMKKFKPTHNKEKNMKTVQPIDIQVAAIREGWKPEKVTPTKAVGVEFVGPNLPPSYGRNRAKYTKIVETIVAHSPQWGIMYQSESNAYCHTRKYDFKKRWGTRVDGSPYMEFVVFKRANGMWAVAARLPYENVL